jgi:mannose-6-phosphate isomerase
MPDPPRAVQAAVTRDVGRFIEAPFPIPLSCDVQHYKWGEAGDSAYIPSFLGVRAQPSLPYAELWIGDNPALPSRALLPDGGRVDLPALVAAAPDTILRHPPAPPRIPFLVKILAAEQALSIQVHPDLAQAAAGFAEENARGIPVPDDRRNFKDANHKPEILIALTPFWGLKGFRPLAEIAVALSAEAPELAPLAPHLEAQLRDTEGDESARNKILQGLYTRAMRADQSEVNRLLGPLLARLRGRPAPPPSDRAFWLLRADREHSRGADKDRGLLSFFLLNLVRLAPGEGVYLGPGEPHAYLKGVGLEVMANSDNVLRGGLTPKHVDIDRLLDILRFSDGAARILEPDADGLYATPAEEFEVARGRLRPGSAIARPGGHGLDVWVAIEGEAEIRWAGAPVPVRRGTPVLVPAKLGRYELAALNGDDVLVFRVSEKAT